MTFSRIKAVGWAVNEKVTSAQLNQLDLDHSKSVDKTGDNLTNSGGISGRVDVISGGTLEVQSGGEIIVHSSGEILVSSGGTVNLTAATMTFNSTAELTFNDTSGLEINGSGSFIIGASGSELCAGTLNITSGGTLGINSGATMHVKNGATATVDGGGALALANGSNVNAAVGSNVNFASGSYLNMSGATLTMDNTSIGSIQGGSILATSGDGYITVQSGGTLTAAFGSNVKFDSFPNFINSQSRYFIQSTVGGIALSGTWSGGAQFVYDNAAGGVWSLQLRTHHGATLDTVTVGFSVGTAHSNAPANLPNLSVKRYAYNAMFSPQALATTDPQYVATPGSGSAWYDSGNQQYMTYFCNQNNIIDNGSYIYVLTITDESGTYSQALNAFGLITMHFTNITSQQWSV